jgi:hypothetical protein
VFVVKGRSWLLPKSGNDGCISSFNKSGASGGSIFRVEAEPARKAPAIYLRNSTSLQTLSINLFSTDILHHRPAFIQYLFIQSILYEQPFHRAILRQNNPTASITRQKQFIQAACRPAVTFQLSVY